jgi:hypothetical protein
MVRAAQCEAADHFVSVDEEVIECDREVRERRAVGGDVNPNSLRTILVADFQVGDVVGSNQFGDESNVTPGQYLLHQTPDDFTVVGNIMTVTW